MGAAGEDKSGRDVQLVAYFSVLKHLEDRSRSLVRGAAKREGVSREREKMEKNGTHTDFCRNAVAIGERGSISETAYPGAAK